MNAGDMYKKAEEERQQRERERQEKAARHKAERESQLETAKAHGAAINSRLRAALEALRRLEFPKAEQAGYKFQHSFGFSRIPALATQQLYSYLIVYIGRNVVDTLDGTPPYRAPYELRFGGNEATGCIDVFYRDNRANQNQQLDTLRAEAELSDQWLHEIFENFSRRMLQSESDFERHRS
jgi:hypothetical protein